MRQEKTLTKEYIGKSFLVFLVNGIGYGILLYAMAFLENEAQGVRFRKCK